MNEITIYGFGSFFRKKIEYKDIDILLIHQNTSRESCQFSLRCKTYLLAKISKADVTILSESEERQLDFLFKSKARYLGKACEKSAEKDIDVILASIKGDNVVDQVTYDQKQVNIVD